VKFRLERHEGSGTQVLPDDAVLRRLRNRQGKGPGTVQTDYKDPGEPGLALASSPVEGRSL
jgi:hypothetical protein